MPLERFCLAHSYVFMVDASHQGHGTVRTTASLDEVRDEARFAETKGWVVEVDEMYTEEEAAESLVDVDGLRGAAPPQSFAAFGSPLFLVLVVTTTGRSQGDLTGWIETLGFEMGRRVRLVLLSPGLHGTRCDFRQPATTKHWARRLRKAEVASLVILGSELMKEPAVMNLFDAGIGGLVPVLWQLPDATFVDALSCDEVDFFDEVKVASNVHSLVVPDKLISEVQKLAWCAIMAAVPSGAKEGHKIVVPPLASVWSSLPRWRLVFKGRWERMEHINVLEFRTMVNVARYLARSATCWDTKYLVLTDSLVALGVLGKGRSSRPSLLALCRRLATMRMILGIRLYARHVVSEMNFADGPSRGFPVGVAPETKTKHAGDLLRSHHL